MLLCNKIFKTFDPSERSLKKVEFSANRPCRGRFFFSSTIFSLIRCSSPLSLTFCIKLPIHVVISFKECNPKFVLAMKFSIEKLPLMFICILLFLLHEYLDIMSHEPLSSR
ncbi:hypothetical protein MtrunA17_Chr1g0182371 [Medicago truncatula]|uniref:Uncharacterized protein n=1 Tax=Medicago truncatula TaxID=3880 RepID=A0A396JUI4_MEDTR|nr:hypothetical protein MtrunA17_Chr1g0182371 [Medicago truncatula]